MDRCLRNGARFAFAQHFNCRFNFFGWCICDICFQQDSVLRLHEWIGMVRYLVEENLTMHSKNAMHVAEELVSINAEQIHLC